MRVGDRVHTLAFLIPERGEGFSMPEFTPGTVERVEGEILHVRFDPQPGITIAVHHDYLARLQDAGSVR